SAGGEDGAAGARAPDAARAGACALASECPPPAGPCQYAVCDAGRCAIVAVAAGSLVAVDEPADCFDTVCDGAGNAVKVVGLNNVPAAVGSCVVNECSTRGQASSRLLVAGSPCGSGASAGLCDGSGACVGCLADADCAGVLICGAAHACVPPSCVDGVQNGAESDIDCGGGACARCAKGKSCTYDADCASGLCRLSDHVCGAPTCDDKRKDGEETDIDCGGSCPPCPI